MRILLADDHALLRDTMKSYLEQSDMQAEVSGVGSLTEAVALLEDRHPFDLILLDIDMPGMNGLSGVATIRHHAADPPVVILSALATPDNVLAALSLGASGFIPKMMGAKSMLMALRLVLTGEKYVPAGLIDSVYDIGRLREREPPEATIALTDEEAHILRLLKQGLANKEIGRKTDMEEYTVKYYVRSIFRKLGAKNRTQAVSIALERNLP